jgi:DNA-binding NtrC family response regulator
VPSRVLVVDDDRAIRRTLEKLLASEGHEVATAGDGRQALDAAGGIDLVLLDLGLPEIDGLEVLRLLHDQPQPPPVVVLTARDDMQSTVRAVQLGAYDYLVKPPDIDRLKLVVRRALESREASRTLSMLLGQAAGDYQVGNIIGKSPAIREIYKEIGAVSVGRATVLISGESGTGKELVAKAIHYASADRDRPFVAVNCTAFARDLLESELFGHVRGAYTGAIGDKAGRFELAGAGTLFLDEVAEIPLDLQAKLLRVLQERVFERVGDARPIPLKARIVAATHRDLDAMVKAETFREDLLYRLKVVEIHIPPLRERPDDIPLLVEALLGKIARELHKPVRYVAPQALALLSSYRWPGNVRELENMLTRAVVLAKSDVLEASLLPLAPDAPAPAAAASGSGSGSGEEAIQPLRVVVKRAIADALRATGWNKRRTSALLGISRPKLDRAIKDHGLEPDGDA